MFLHCSCHVLAMCTLRLFLHCSCIAVLRLSVNLDYPHCFQISSSQKEATRSKITYEARCLKEEKCEARPRAKQGHMKQKHTRKKTCAKPLRNETQPKKIKTKTTCFNNILHMFQFSSLTKHQFTWYVLHCGWRALHSFIETTKK